MQRVPLPAIRHTPSARGAVADAPHQLARVPALAQVSQRRDNGGGLPVALTSGIERLSGQ